MFRVGRQFRMTFQLNGACLARRNYRYASQNEFRNCCRRRIDADFTHFFAESHPGGSSGQLQIRENREDHRAGASASAWISGKTDFFATRERAQYLYLQQNVHFTVVNVTDPKNPQDR